MNDQIIYRNNVKVWGNNSTTMLFAHGFGCDQNIPALIMQCSDDLIAPYEVGDYLHTNLKGSTLKVMKATGHCPHMSHPEETISIMNEYLSGIN